MLKQLVQKTSGGRGSELEGRALDEDDDARGIRSSGRRGKREPNSQAGST